MKIINSSVARKNVEYFGFSTKSKTLASLKKIAHKRERARMSRLAAKELLMDHFDRIAERKEIERLACEAAYYELMRRVVRSSGKRKNSSLQHRHPVVIEEPIGESRSDFLIVMKTHTGKHELQCVASCAV